MCPTLLAAGYNAIEMSGDSVPLEVTPQVAGTLLSQVRDAIARLEAIETGLTTQILMMIKAGKRVAGFHIEQGVGREKWRVPEQEVIAMAQLMGISVAKQKLITPKQAVAAGLPRELVDSFTETPSTGAKLTADDNARLRMIFK